MKMVGNRKDEKGRTIITVESFLFKKKTDYLAREEIVTEFYDWVKLPHKTIVPDSISFQLDAWKKDSGI